MSDTRCAFQYIKEVLKFQFVNGKIAVQFYDDKYFICNEKFLCFIPDSWIAHYPPGYCMSKFVNKYLLRSIFMVLCINIVSCNRKQN
jgi:hypothetical protein